MNAHDELGKIKILAVSGDKGLLATIFNLLKPSFKNISLASCGTQAIGRLFISKNENSPDTAKIVVADTSIPDMKFDEFCRKIRELSPSTSILAVLHEEPGVKYVKNISDFLMVKNLREEILSRVSMLAGASRGEKSSEKDKNQSSETLLPGNRIPHIGDTVNSYMILDTLGWNSFSIVYKVMNCDDHSIHALKMLTKYGADLKYRLRRFEEETKRLSEIKARNTVKLVDTGIHENCPYFVMDYIDGTDLEEYLIVYGIPSYSLALKAAKQISAALCDIHSLKILHRDIKLKNILVRTSDEEFFLGDFGVARDIKGSRITSEGFVVGTPLYMAPELFRGEKAGIKSDIYSFGATIYHFITGNPPFPGKNSFDMISKFAGNSARPIRAFRPEFPEWLDHLIVKKCMAKTPGERPESMEEVFSELEEHEKNKHSEIRREKAVILLVDNNKKSLHALKYILDHEGKYTLVCAENQEKAAEILSGHDKIKLVITEHRPPELDGIALLRKAKEQSPEIMRIILSGSSEIRSIVSAVNEGLVYKFVIRPWNDDFIRLTVRRAVEKVELLGRNRQLEKTIQAQNHELSEMNRFLEDKIKKRTKELRDANINLEQSLPGIIKALSKIVSIHSGEIKGHGRRVAILSRRLAECIGLDSEKTRELEIAGVLHETGQIAVPREIIDDGNSEKLRNTEMEIHRQHPITAWKILKEIPELKEVAMALKFHHEKYGGGGYPENISGEDIPLITRILSVADCFDEMAYRSNSFGEKDRKIIYAKMSPMAGKELDPTLVDTFIKNDCGAVLGETYESFLTHSPKEQETVYAKNTLKTG